ncbi:MAG TPA: carboxypeptidase-like regulatory domain-containing protein, partial [Terriglobales bacterium]|nr:carboxypeptidase-like regulatory domain-containing protein [Terriglobales bacterium]
MTCCADSRCGVTESSGSKTWVVASRPVILLLLVSISTLGQDAPPPSSFSITGVVKSGNTPIPGATVSATHFSTEAKTTTYTDINGAYTLQVAAAGKYQVRVEMPAFEPST